MLIKGQNSSGICKTFGWNIVRNLREAQAGATGATSAVQWAWNHLFPVVPLVKGKKHFWNLRHVWQKPMGFFFCVPHGFPQNNPMFCGFPHVFPKTIPWFSHGFIHGFPFFHQASRFFRRPAEPRMRLVQRRCTSPETLLGADFVRFMMKTIGKP